jgi:subtilisin family serine protease
MFRLVLICLICLFAASASARDWKSGDAPDRVLVLYKEWAGAGRLDRAAALKKREALHSAAGGRLWRRTPLVDLDIVKLNAAGPDAVARALAVYRASDWVASAEPDPPVRALAPAPPNDPAFVAGAQWSLTLSAWTAAWEAWKEGQFSLPNRITVAVLDTGVDAHPDFASGQLLPGASFVEGAATSDDDEGHGTFVAGLIAATPNNGMGVAGAFMDPDRIRLLPVKVLDAEGRGFYSDMVAGLLYAVEQGARVVNMSLGGPPEDSAVLRAAVAAAARQGVVLVAAAGNDHGAPANYPAALPEVISVAALGPGAVPADYNNAGKVDLSAPGGAGLEDCSCRHSASGCAGELWSLAATVATCPWLVCSGACLSAGGGTSFAAPLVSAAAAMLLSREPGLDWREVLQRLIQSAGPTSRGAGFHRDSGWGALDFKRLLIEDRPAAAPAAVRVWSWPNPFNPEGDAGVSFNLRLPASQDAELRLLDGGGQLVRVWHLQASQTVAGSNIVAWDGRNGEGQSVANGTYLLVLESGGQRATHRVAVLR